MLPRVKNIISVEPFKVKVLWNTGEIRDVDFSEMLQEYKTKPRSTFAQLLDYQRFKKVKTDGRTLYWDDLLLLKTNDGKTEPAPLDICPDVLYEMSK